MMPYRNRCIGTANPVILDSDILMKRIIIDCDPGNGIPGANVDDGLALGLAVASKKLCLDLITIVAGNTPRDVGYQVALDFVRELDLAIPVVKGAAKALVEVEGPWRDYLDKRHLMDENDRFWENTPKFELKMDNSPDVAAERLGRLVCDNPDQITVVAIGPLTNIANAIMHYSQFSTSVARIVIMGGVFHLEQYLKDTNFGFDPEAAKIVLESGAAITLVPYDVTMTTLFTLDDINKLERIPNPLTYYLARTFRPWVRYSIKTRQIGGSWIHDAVCVALLIDPHLVATESYRVEVVLEGNFTRGSSRRWKADGLKLAVAQPKDSYKPIDVATKINNKKLMKLIFSTLRCFNTKV